MFTAKFIDVSPSKTYATKGNALAAVDKLYNTEKHVNATELRFIVVCNEAGRWYPIFIGASAARAQVFVHFPVVMGGVA
jgi:hypothetical protein